MPLSGRAQRRLGVLLFTSGVLLSLALGLLAIWGDLEASLFDPSEQAQERLTSLRCPVLITRQEVGQVWASFKNTGQRPVERAVRAHISRGLVTFFREESVKLPLQPGESRRWSWEVTAADAAFGGTLILVRVSTLRQTPLPSQSNTCGIVVVDAPVGKGSALVGLWLAAGVTALLAGAWIWHASGLQRSGRRRDIATAMAVVGAITLGIVAMGLTGHWLAGMLLTVLLILVLIALFTQRVLET